MGEGAYLSQVSQHLVMTLNIEKSSLQFLRIVYICFKTMYLEPCF